MHTRVTFPYYTISYFPVSLNATWSYSYTTSYRGMRLKVEISPVLSDARYLREVSVNLTLLCRQA